MVCWIQLMFALQQCMDRWLNRFIYDHMINSNLSSITINSILIWLSIVLCHSSNWWSILTYPVSWPIIAQFDFNIYCFMSHSRINIWSHDHAILTYPVSWPILSQFDYLLFYVTLKNTGTSLMGRSHHCRIKGLQNLGLGT